MNAQLDIFSRTPTRISRRGMERKQAGQERALKNEAPEWRVAALVLLEKFCSQHHAGHAFAFEDYRTFALSRGLQHPHAHQCWGALASAAAKAGMIERTGDYRPANSPRTNRHPVTMWRVVA